jgi:4-aminobutyrate aminotransferase
MFQDAMAGTPCIGDVRGNGLMIGIEVVADKATREPLAGEKVGEIAFRLLNEGILMTPCGRHANVFRFMPPLTIPRDYAVKASEVMLGILKDY